MAELVTRDSTDHGLILDLTIKRSSPFVDVSKTTTSAENVNDTKYRSSPAMDWQEESCLSVPTVSTQSGGYDVENKLPVITRISKADTTVSDNRESYSYMDWEDENRSQSVPILGTTSREGDHQRMLPFKKRRILLQSRIPWSDDLQLSTPVCLEQARQVVIADVNRDMYVTRDASQTDSVTVLVQNMAAMHTGPGQRQPEQRDPEVSDNEHSGDSSRVSDQCPLRGRGLYPVELTTEQQTQSETCQGLIILHFLTNLRQVIAQ